MKQNKRFLNLIKKVIIAFTFLMRRGKEHTAKRVKVKKRGKKRKGKVEQK